MMAAVFKVEEEFIETVRRKRMEFLEKFTMGRLKEEESNCIRMLYSDKKFNALTGKQAKTVCTDCKLAKVINHAKYKLRNLRCIPRNLRRKLAASAK